MVLGMCVKSKDMSSFGVIEIIWFVCILFYFVSSPYLLVFGDDHVLRYTWADDVTGGFGEA